MITAGSMESSLPSSTKGLDSSLRIKRKALYRRNQRRAISLSYRARCYAVNHRAHG